MAIPIASPAKLRILMLIRMRAPPFVSHIIHWSAVAQAAWGGPCGAGVDACGGSPDPPHALLEYGFARMVP